MSQTTPAPAIGTLTLLRVLWRSFFIQAANNYQRMQSVGFVFCMTPALTRLYEGDQLKDALARHLEFFNSHPYMTGALLGASIRLEEAVARGERPPQDVQNFKRFMQGPMAAIGDSFFWSSLRPFLAAWAVMGILSGLWWAPLGFLILFNICHLGLRAYGLFVGYRTGEEVCERINRLALVRFSEQTHWLAAIFLGASAAFFADRASESMAAFSDTMEPFLLLALTLIFLLGQRRGIPMIGLLYGAAAITTVLLIYLNSFFPVV